MPAYHLASVVDDAWQAVTHVVRGRDLLESTHVHRHLQRALGFDSPVYAHVPVLVGADARKLSKRTGATPVDALEPSAAAEQALRLLGADVPAELAGAPPAELWGWAGDRWQLESLSGTRVIAVR